jgi:acyl-ACP thioesterase
MIDIWREQYPVRFGDADRSDRLTLGAALGYFQEAAIDHAEVLGCGRDELARIRQGWVLSRMSVFMEARPRYRDVACVESWPRGAEHLFARRDYAIRDTEGRALVRGRGDWLILDIEKRRPLRAEPVMAKLPLNDGVNGLADMPPALPAHESLASAGKRVAAYSDIDFYGHVNNARYIQWIEDMTDIGALTDARQMRLDINYLIEIKPGETVELFCGPISALPETKDGAPLCKEDYPAQPTAACAYAGFACGEDGVRSDKPSFRAELRLGN